MLRNMAATIAAFLLAIALAPSAEAKHRHHRHYHAAPATRVHSDPTGCFGNNDGRIVCGGPVVATVARTVHRVVRASADYVGHIVGHPHGCPHTAFCGCGASVEVFGRPIRELYLAANWFKYPHATPAPGMVAVRQHHVFVIREVNSDGTVVAYDANSGGHLTRVHTVSLRGYSVRNPHG